MRSNPYRPPSKHVQAAPVRQAPLGDARFQELVSRASQFFASAERDEVAEKVAQQFERPERAAKTKHWDACLRLLDRTDPSYKH